MSGKMEDSVYLTPEAVAVKVKRGRRDVTRRVLSGKTKIIGSIVTLGDMKFKRAGGYTATIKAMDDKNPYIRNWRIRVCK